MRLSRLLDRATSALAQGFERLSSGLRINRASDDAAGLSISASLRSDSRIFGQAIRNVNDGVSMLNIAEGTLGELSTVTIRLRELATQSANGTLSSTQRRALDREADQLVAEYNRLTATTRFNGLSLFGTPTINYSIQGGIGSAEATSFRIGDELGRNVGSGNYSQSNLGAGSPTGAVVSIDFDGDGDLDTLSAQSGGSNALVWQNNGSGSFTNLGTVNSGLTITGMLSGDFDGDGDQDVVAYNSTSLRFLRNNGSGSFTTPSTVMIVGISALAAIEINSNFPGLEIAAMDSAGTLASVVFVPATGQSNVFVADASGYQVPTELVAGDINGDGIQDLIASGGSGNTVGVFIGKGNTSPTANFYAPTYYSAGLASTNLVTGDFNNDGIVDVAAKSATEVSILLGQANGTLAFSNKYAMTGSELFLADLNTDGLMDLISDTQRLNGVFDGTFQSASSHSGSTVATYGDFTGDGVVDYIRENSAALTLFAQGVTEEASLGYLNLTTRSGALSAISTIDTALRRINAEQGAIGSIQSRFSSSLATLQERRLGYESAASAITDADTAEEAAGLARNQILQQVSSAILGQANLSANIALFLLTGEKKQ